MPVLAKPIGPLSEERKAKILSMVDRDGDCWEWTGYRNPKGYGQIEIAGSKRRAHRVIMTILHGSEIDPAIQIDHICRNRACCNPEHLRLVDHKTNAIENSAGLSAVNIRKTHCIRGHEFTHRNTYVNKRTGYRSCRRCHADYVAVWEANKKSEIGNG